MGVQQAAIFEFLLGPEGVSLKFLQPRRSDFGSVRRDSIEDLSIGSHLASSLAHFGLQEDKIYGYWLK